MGRVIETAALATYLVGSFLVPLVKKGAEKLTEDLGAEAGSTVATGLVETARKLWDRVRGKTENTDDKPVVDLFAQQPDKLQATLTEVVKRLLDEDPTFREEASALLEEREGDKTRWQLMGEYVGAVDARGAHISGGQVGGVIVGGSPGVPPPPPSSPLPSDDRSSG
jgi:hypothetical protein